MRATFTLPVLVLILANLVPLFGVLMLGWSVGNILVLYWLESVLIGLINLVKILSSQGVNPKKRRKTGLSGKLFLAIFFTFHYGMFTGVHGVFVAEIFGGLEALRAMRESGALLWVALGFAVSHGFSLLVNYFAKGEYLSRSPDQQMIAPYGRVFVMHIVILFGGALVQASGSPIWALIVLIVLKTGIDIAAHQISHRLRAHENESRAS